MFNRLRASLFAHATGTIAASCLASAHAVAQIAVSSNDHKMVQEHGVTRNLLNPPPDTITILDLGVSPVKVLATLSDVPGSVVGPPFSVAITPDESLALVANSTRTDPDDKSKTSPDNRVSVIDLHNRKVLNRIVAGAGAAGLSVTKNGKVAYVANRMAGSISILSIDGLAVRLARTEQVAKPTSLLSHVAVAPDGVTGVATLDGEAKVMVIQLAGDNVSVAGRLDVAPRPYAAAITPDSKTAVVASRGDPNGNGMLTVIDIGSDPAGKIVGTVDTGYEALEGMMMSPNGRWVAAVLQAGSTRPEDAPQYRPNGMVVLYRLEGTKLTKTSEAPIGAWSRGAAFSRDGATLVVQNMIQHNLMVFRIEHAKLFDTGQTIDVVGGAAAIRTSTGP
jgi:DNA-binding beta-propeller fold protein YncE